MKKADEAKANAPSPVPAWNGRTAWNTSWSCDKDGLCGCCTDCCTCWAVCCCSIVTAPQLHDRVVEKGSCKWSFAFLVVLFIAAGVFNFIYTTSVSSFYASHTLEPNEEIPSGAIAHWARSVAFGLQMTYFMFMLIIVMSVRKKLRERDGLQDKCCGLEDCCCAFWCDPCTQCLLFRRLGLGGGKYSFISADGVSITGEAAPLAQPLAQP
jgi:hypothetical protein